MKDSREEIDRRIEDAWQRFTGESEEIARVAAEIARESDAIGYEEGVARGRIVEAAAAIYQAEYERAAELAAGGREKADATGDHLWRLRSRYVLGLVARNEQTPQRAIELYEEGLDLLDLVEDRREQLLSEATLLTSIAFAQRAAGRSDDAEKAFVRVGEIGEEVDGDTLRAQSAYGRAFIFVDRAEFDEATPLLDRVEELLGDEEASILLTSALQLRGRILSESGRLADALANEIAIGQSWEARGYYSGAGLSLCNAGFLALSLGNYRQALELMSHALNLAVSYGLREIEAIALQQIAQVYEAVGEDPLVVEHYVRSMTIAAEVNAWFTESVALYFLSLYYERHGLTGRALSGYLRCLHLARTIERRAAEFTLLDAIGRLYLSIGEVEKAETYIDEGLEASGPDGPRAERIDLLVSRAMLCRRRGEFEQAEEHLDEAIELGDTPDLYDRNRKIVAELRELARATRRDDLTARAERIADDRVRSSFDAGGGRRSGLLLREYEAEYLRYHAGRFELDDDQRSEVERIARLEITPDPSVTIARQSSELEEEPSLPDTSGVRVTTFGRFLLEIEGKKIDAGAFARRRARDLFKLLLLDHRTVVTVDRIEEALWGEPVEKIGPLVMNAASHIRSAIGASSDEDAPGPRLLRRGDGYLLDLGADAAIDFLRFKERIVEARHAATAAERLALYTEACTLATGPFLPEVDAPWIDNERAMIDDAWFEGMEFIVRELVRTGRTNEAMTESRRLLARDSTNVAAWTTLFEALRAADRTTQLAEEQERCREAFREMMGEEPPEGLVG